MVLNKPTSPNVSRLGLVPPPSDARNRPLDATGLEYKTATRVEEVVAAWQLVYRSYRRAGLINPNPARLHTMARVIGPETLVAYGSIRSVVTSTLSSYLDNPRGLPLDAVYPDELAQLREQGRRFSEVGLFADRREQFARSINSHFELMRFAYFHARHAGMDDVIIGVHPRHAPFYVRLIGFTCAGPEKSYATVNDHPVVLLRLDLRMSSSQPKPPRGLKYFLSNPLPASTYADAFRFAQGEVADSDIGRYLEWKRQQIGLTNSGLTIGCSRANDDIEPQPYTHGDG